MSGTPNSYEWQGVVQRVTKNDNERQRMTTSDNKWQWVTAIESKWYTNWKLHSSLQIMDDCDKTQKQIHYFNGWMAAIRVVK